MKRLLLSVALILVFVVPSEATLYDRGSNLIYCDTLDITILADPNIGGAMAWDDALLWAENLEYYDSVRNMTYDDWRLPTALSVLSDPTAEPDWGYDAIYSEMGDIYYTELGNSAHGPLTNSGGFLLPYSYWAGTEYDLDTGNAWSFGFHNGIQQATLKTNTLHVLAVRSGDVGAPVPEPATIMLLVCGLSGMAVNKRLKKDR